MPSTRYSRELLAHVREACLLFEVDFNECGNVIGDFFDAPPGLCTVSPVPPDGQRCDYCYHGDGLTVGCLDRPNFNPTVRTWRMLSRKSNIPVELHETWAQLWPNLEKVTGVGQEIDVEAGFTRPDQLTIKLTDIGAAIITPDGAIDLERCPELRLDKPADRRNRSRKGFAWRRLIQQYPNIKESPVRVFRGFIIGDWLTTDFEPIWEGRVDNVSFDGTTGVTIKASDWLLGLERAVPPATDATITSDLSTEVTSIPVEGIDQFTDPASISGLVVVRTLSIWTGRYEYMTVTARDEEGGSIGSLAVIRGTHGSQKEPHAKDQLLEEVFTTLTQDGLSGTVWPEIVIDLLERGGIPASAYDAAQIRAMTKWTGSWQFKLTVPEEGEDPEETSIHDLIFELIGDLFIGNLMLAPDLKLNVLVSAPAEPSETVTAIADQDVKSGSLSVNLNDAGRLTAVVFHYDKIEGEDKFRHRIIALNGETTAEGYYPGRKVKIIKSRWLSPGHRTLAQESAVLRNILFAQPPERVVWESELRAAGLPMGGLVDITSFEIQDHNGEPRVHQGRVIKKEWDALAAFTHLSQSTGYASGKRWFFIQANGITSYDTATDQQRIDGAFLGEIFDGATHDTDDFNRADEAPLSTGWLNLGFVGDEFDLIDQEVTAKDTGVISNPAQHMEKTANTPLTANGSGWVQARCTWFGDPNEAKLGGVGGNYKASFASVHALLRTIRVGGVSTSSLEVTTGLGGSRISHGSIVIPTLLEGRPYTLRIETLDELFKLFIDGVLAMSVVPNSFWWPYAGGSRRPSLVIEGTGDRSAGWWTFDDLEAGEPLLDGVRVGSALDPGYCII